MTVCRQQGLATDQANNLQKLLMLSKFRAIDKNRSVINTSFGNHVADKFQLQEIFFLLLDNFCGKINLMMLILWQQV